MHRRWLIVLLTVVGCLAASACAGTVKTFDDEFSAAPLGSAWTALNRPGDASNSEAQCYRPANVVEQGGSLVITSKVDTSCPGHRYTSGMVQWKTANFTFGTLEFRARFAGGTGTWPAVWMLGLGCQTSNPSTPDNVGTCHWPGPGSQEIDVAEIYGGGRTSVHQGLITPAGAPGCNAATTDVSTNWHVYTLVWAPGSLVWKIDGKITCTVRENVPITPMFVMINTALGGSSGGTIVDSTLPAQTFIDYLRVVR